MSVAGKSVTVQLTNHNYGSPPTLFQEGSKIKLGRNMWCMSAQRIKNKFMVHRLLRKEYYPYLITTNVVNGEGEITLSVKPYNF